MKSRFGFTSALALLVAALFLVPTHALADRGHHGKGHHMKKMIEALDLNEDQKSQVQAIMQQFRESKKAQKEQMRAEKKALWEMAGQGNANDQQLRDQFRKVSSLKEEMFLERVRMMRAVRGVLTPEQQEKWQQIKEEKMQKFREKHERYKKGESEGSH